jgi:hypothetical protein
VSSSPVALWLETETAGNGSAYAAQACREARAPPLSGCDQGINFQAHLLALCGACCRGPCRRFTYRPALVWGGSITRASATPFASSSLAGRTVSCTELPRISLAIHHPLWISTNRTIISHLPDIRNRASIGKTDPPWPPGPANGPLSANCSRHFVFDSQAAGYGDAYAIAASSGRLRAVAGGLRLEHGLATHSFGHRTDSHSRHAAHTELVFSAPFPTGWRVAASARAPAAQPIQLGFIQICPLLFHTK